MFHKGKWMIFLLSFAVLVEQTQMVSAKEFVRYSMVENVEYEENGEETVLPPGIESVITAPSYILMEASTGQIVCEKNATERRCPASITKIMTLLLAFESLANGQMKLEDHVITSEYASSMGGSQVFLAQGEEQSVDTLLKCIAVSSGNDASVALAEHIAGSEDAFVEMMNEKALSIGMTDTHFEDCCGLTNSDQHYTTAKDVAKMSKELITTYPEVFQYTKIWMEDITHVTRQGTSNFTLSSTNKLLKQYQWTTGLKTGSTDKAKYCLSATANKGGIDLIAVVMGSPEPKGRFADARILLEHGFHICQIYVDSNQEPLPKLPVKRGVEEDVSLKYQGEFRYLDMHGMDFQQVKKVIELPEKVLAPVVEGEAIGRVKYLLNGTEIGTISILYAQNVERAEYLDCLRKIFNDFLL